MAKHAAAKGSPVETKVALQAGGGTLGAALSGFIVWLLGVTVWGVPFTADRATDAMGAVPLPVSGLLAVLLTIGFGAYAGWAAPHTVRPDLEDAAPPAVSLAPYGMNVDAAPVMGQAAAGDSLRDDEQARDARGRFTADA